MPKNPDAYCLRTTTSPGSGATDGCGSRERGPLVEHPQRGDLAPEQPAVQSARLVGHAGVQHRVAGAAGRTDHPGRRGDGVLDPCVEG